MQINLDALPALSPLVPALLELDVEAGDAEQRLLHIVESEPALSARLIAVANSAAFGLPRVRYATIASALRRIGLRRSAQLATAVLVGAPLTKRLPASLTRALWLHALAVAVAAQEIARLKRHPEPGSAYLLGLVHDLGYMAMEYLQPCTLDEVVKRTSRDNITQEQAEFRVFGLQHPGVAAQLLQAWKLPEALIEPIRNHHELDVAPDSLAAIVFGAEKIARCECVVESLYDGLDHPFRPLAMDRLGIEFMFDQQLELTSEAVDRLVDRIVEQVAALRDGAGALAAA